MSYSARRAVAMYLGDQCNQWEFRADAIEQRLSEFVPGSQMYLMQQQRAQDFRDRAAELHRLAYKVMVHVKEPETIAE